MSDVTPAPADTLPAGSAPTAPQARRRAAATVAMVRRELSSYFQTPVAWVVGAVFLGVTASLFFSVFFLFERAELRQFFGLLPVLLALLMPALAMRLVAEERRRGTWEILATLPVSNTQIVCAKFIALWLVGLFLLAPTLFFAVTVGRFGPLDPGPVVAGYLGAALLVAVYGAAGIFASALGRNETVALIIGLVISLTLALLDGLVVLIPAEAVSLVQFLGTGYHFTGFTRGVVDTRSVVYLVSATLFFLVLTHQQLQRRR
jgi:ABC-2 type transport system permease protein